MLTIITVTKDDFEGLVKTVESTKELRASGSARQIIIDSSCPETRKAVAELARQNENVASFWQTPAGIAPAFNFGISKAETDWVWFLNGGDQAHPTLSSANLLYLLGISNADAIIFQIEFVQSGERYPHPPMWGMWPPVYNWIPHPATVIRKSVFEKHGNFDESYRIAMDGELWLRVFAKDVVVDTLSAPIALFDQTGVSSEPKAVADEVHRMLKAHSKMLFKRWYENGKMIYQAIRLFSKRKNGR